MIDLPRLEQFLSAAGRLTIGLVGDLFLDRYLEIDPQLDERSVETGLQAYQVTRVRNSPGALGTVINNLAALGAGRLLPVSVVGDDGQAYDLAKELAALGVEADYVLRDPARLTPTYTKPMRPGADGLWRELNRLDLRNRAPLARPVEDRLLDCISEVFHKSDGLIVLDQVNEEGWGVVGPRVRGHLAELNQAEPEKLVFVDSRAHLDRFNFGALKPNVRECLAALGERSTAIDEPAEPQRACHAARALCARHGQTVFCTLGERGMLVAWRAVAAGRGGSVETAAKIELAEVPGYPAAGPVDPVGAGDSATAGIVVALLAGASPVEAAAVGNLVASITVEQIGATGTAAPAQVIARWRERHS